MLTHRRMIKCIQPQDWFAAIDLKDAYFHVSILPRYRPFLATTLRIYVAAIAARRDSDDVPLSRYRLVSSFMHGAKRLRPVRPLIFPSWDLSVVLKVVARASF